MLNDQEQPLCLHCLSPYDPLSDYCPSCGAVVGQLTPYKPYEGIRYNTAPFGTLWRKTWRSKETPTIVKCMYLVMIFLFAPIMLLGLPFELYAFIKRRRKRNEANCGDTQIN